MHNHMPQLPFKMLVARNRYNSPYRLHEGAHPWSLLLVSICCVWDMRDTCLPTLLQCFRARKHAPADHSGATGVPARCSSIQTTLPPDILWTHNGYMATPKHCVKTLLLQSAKLGIKLIYFKINKINALYIEREFCSSCEFHDTASTIFPKEIGQFCTCFLSLCDSPCSSLLFCSPVPFGSIFQFQPHLTEASIYIIIITMRIGGWVGDKKDWCSHKKKGCRVNPNHTWY